ADNPPAVRPTCNFGISNFQSGIRPISKVFLCLLLLSGVAHAQAPDLTGVWGPYRGGRGADPKLAPPAATPLVLKPQYAKPYEARRKSEADAAAKGEPIASGAVACVPYGMPRMMSVALYPIEILPTPGQITLVTEGVR